MPLHKPWPQGDARYIRASKEGREIWVGVPGFQGCYQLSTLGRVRSLHWRIIKKHYPERELRKHVLKPFNSGAYPSVTLCDEFGKHRRYLHILVLKTFVGPRPDGMEGRHMNGMKKDARLHNLRWGTPVQNAADRERHGTHLKGEDHVHAKLTQVQVEAIRRTIHIRGELTRLALKYGVAKSTMSKIKNGKRYKVAT